MIVVIRRTLRRFLQLQQVGSKSNIIYRTLCDVMRTLLQHSFENDDSVHFIFRAKMSVEDFAQFLKNEQRDAIGDDVSKVSQLMTSYLERPTREASEPYFSRQEFVSFLFSSYNSLLDESCCRTYMDMNQPLTRYWIASSHNTCASASYQNIADQSQHAMFRSERSQRSCLLQVSYWRSVQE